MCIDYDLSMSGDNINWLNCKMKMKMKGIIVIKFFHLIDPNGKILTLGAKTMKTKYEVQTQNANLNVGCKYKYSL